MEMHKIGAIEKGRLPNLSDLYQIKDLLYPLAMAVCLMITPISVQAIPIKINVGQSDNSAIKIVKNIDFPGSDKTKWIFEQQYAEAPINIDTRINNVFEMDTITRIAAFTGNEEIAFPVHVEKHIVVLPVSEPGTFFLIGMSLAIFFRARHRLN